MEGLKCPKYVKVVGKDLCQAMPSAIPTEKQDVAGFQIYRKPPYPMKTATTNRCAYAPVA